MNHKKYVCVPPPIESLLEDSATRNYWPKELVNDPVFNQQIVSQRSLLQQVQYVFAALPLQMTVADGLTQGLLTETDVECLFTALALQLESSEAQQRLAMYLPFELLSPITASSPCVTRASQKLHTAYRSAWEQQLYVHDVRANYVDGDILEPELRTGDHPRVVKAAHLIPGLLSVGHFTEADVLDYESRANHQLLVGSIHDACMVAADLGLLAAHHTAHMSLSKSNAPLIPVGMTPNRAAWLTKVAEANVRLEKAVKLAQLLIAGTVPHKVLNAEPIVGLEALRMASLTDSSVAVRYRDWLNALRQSDLDGSVRDSFVTLCAHLYAIGILDATELTTLRVAIPNLAGPFYDNRSRLDPTEAEITDMCRQLASHPRLSELVYPAATVFGSRVKGYGASQADCDLAVFVRPGTDRMERTYLEEELPNVFAHQYFDRRITLFWLTEIGTRLRVVDTTDTSTSDGCASWIHILFGALWFGEEDTLKTLHKRLLTTYFTTPTTVLDGRPTYVRWLEEMERDTLQYRLLHRGFERYFPVQSPVDTVNGNLIDGKSAFYDSRYRRIATELFLRRVFLPQL